MEKKKSQKDVVFEIIKDVLGDLYSPNEKMRRHFCNGRGHKYYKSSSGSIQRMERAVELFLKRVECGDIEKPNLGNYEWEDHKPEVKLEKYARRIIFNWLNRDSRLNGSKEYDLNQKILSEDKVLREINSLIHDINTKEVWTGWGRSRRLTTKLKEMVELTSNDRKMLKELDKLSNERKKTLLKYGKYLPDIVKCLKMKDTDKFIASFRSAENYDDLNLLLEKFIFHILQNTDPMSSKEDGILKKKAS